MRFLARYLFRHSYPDIVFPCLLSQLDNVITPLSSVIMPSLSNFLITPTVSTQSLSDLFIPACNIRSSSVKNFTLPLFSSLQASAKRVIQQLRSAGVRERILGSPRYS